MNVELLQQIKAAILAEPDAFRMDTWSCGTAHCIAGWALKLSGLTVVNTGDVAYKQKLTDGRYPSVVAAGLLGITYHPDGFADSDRLFCDFDWPEKFEAAFDLAQTRAEKARIAADRIDHFIATEGRE